MSRTKPSSIDTSLRTPSTPTDRLILLSAVPGHSFRQIDEIREVVRLRTGMTDDGVVFHTTVHLLDVTLWVLGNPRRWKTVRTKRHSRSTTTFAATTSAVPQ